jgi:hypothetical protein
MGIGKYNPDISSDERISSIPSDQRLPSSEDLKQLYMKAKINVTARQNAKVNSLADSEKNSIDDNNNHVDQEHYSQQNNPKKK